MVKQPIICVVGTTASGKSDLAVKIAKKYNGEVVSADSMQIYRGFDIGTAKITESEMMNIPHHLIDIIDGNMSYSVADYVKDANTAVSDIISRGKLPVIAGGTGLYIDNFVNNTKFFEFEKNSEYCNYLDDIEKQNGEEKLWQMLKTVDPDLAVNIPIGNVKRIKHGLEVYNYTGKTYKQLSEESKQDSPYNACKIGLKYADRELLYNKINARVDKMVDLGLVDEVEKLLKIVPENSQAMSAIGYKEIVKYLKKECSLEEAIDAVKMNSRRYAKRQLTWFRRDSSIHWIDVDNCDSVFDESVKITDNFLRKR